MDGIYNELVSMINKYEETVENTKNIYETESGNLYRKIALGYIEFVQNYLNNDLKPYIGRLDEIKSVYIDEYNAIAYSIHGGTK